MPTYALEGTGASVVFATSGFSSDILSIVLPEQVRAIIDTTHLGTTVAKTSKPAKLKDVGEIVIETDHNPAAANLVMQAPETIKINYPLKPGQTTPDNLSFTGYATKMGGEDFKVDTKLTTKMSLKVSGDLLFALGT